MLFQYVMNNLGSDEMNMKMALNENDERLPCKQRCTFQTEKVVVTSSRYPSPNTFVRRQDMCLTVAKIQRICDAPLRRARFLRHYASQYPIGDICATNEYYFNFMGICNRNNFTINRSVQVSEDFVKVLLQYAKDNLVVLKVFFKEPYYTSIVKKDKISHISFVATVGGLVGLCMGLSFVSVAEWVYHFGKLLYKYLKA